MAIRKNTNPQRMDLQPEMRDLLMRNGMQAHVVSNGSGYQLVVQGHDSPLLTYHITEKQMLALTDWGTNHANKLAYNTFTGIVANDFYMPKNFVHARNANGRVAMGLHGYRVGIGEYGRTGRIGMPPPFLGWTPRSQEGFHLRRVGGWLFFPEAPIVPERWDGRMKPGELQSGGYGFFYKGQQQGYTLQQQDVLKDLEGIITPTISRPRSTESAKAYNELITSPVYFTNEKWQECLASHGIIVDAGNKTLTIQSNSVNRWSSERRDQDFLGLSRVVTEEGEANADMVYDLTDEELKRLTSNSIKEVPVAQRLEILNNVIKEDFADKVTMDMLNSKESIDMHLHPDIEQELQERQQQDEERLLPLEEEETVKRDVLQGDAMVRGEDLALLNENKGWYREGAHGREVEVGDIMVEKIPQTEGEKKGEAQYRMTAIINGEAITHEIKQKDYDKFLAVDDYHRMKLFSKVFNEVDMKTRPEANAGLGTKILAALTAGAVVTAEVAHDMNHPHHHPAPEFYAEHHGPAPRPYFKLGVDSPQEIAARNFEAQANQVATEIRRGY